FKALSYAWGSTDTPQAELVMSSTSSNYNSGTLGVQRNLYEALRYLHFPTKRQTLWMNAICINQEDLDEMNKQIKRMKSLYEIARHVVVWLGPSSDNSDLECLTLSR
ncbi:hypothetical protein BU25DRAFT_331629, partial [Macroventuria anomochaeta]